MAESRKYTQIPKIITPRPSLPSPLHSRKTSSSGQESPSPKSSANDSTGSSIPSFRTLKNLLVFNKSQSDGGSPKGTFSLGAVRKSLAGERKASSSSLDQKEYDDPNVADIIIGPISSPMHQDLSTILESDTSALSRHRVDHDDSQDDIRLQLPLTSRSHPPSGRQSPESTASSQLDLSTTKLGEEVRNAMTSKTVGWSSDVILDELSKESTRVIDIEPLNPDVANLLGPSQRLLARSQSSSPIRESPFDTFNVGAQSSPTHPRVHRRIPTLSSLPKGPQPSSGITTHNSSPTSRTSFDQRDKDRFTPRRNLQFGPSPPNSLTLTSTTQVAKDRLYSPASRFATPSTTTRLPSHRSYPFSDSESTTPSSSGRPSTRLSSDIHVSSSSSSSRPGSAAMREHLSRNRSMSVSESSTTSGPIASRQYLGSGSGTIRPALRNPPLNRSTSASHHPVVGQIGPSASRAFAAAGLFSEGSVNGGRDSRAHSRLSDDVRSSGSAGPLSRLSDHTRSSSIDRPSSGMRGTISTTTNTYYPPLYTTPSRSSVSGETEASSAYGGSGGIPRPAPRSGRNRSLSQTLTMSELGVLSSSTAGSNSSNGRHGHGHGRGSIATTVTSRTGSSLSVSIPRHRPRNSGSGGGSSSARGGGSPSGGRPSPSPYYPYPRTASSSAASRSSPTFTGSTSTATTMTGSMTSGSSMTTTTSASAASSAIVAMREKHELEMEALLSALSDSQRASKGLREENNGLRDKVIVLEEEVDEVRGENEEFRAALVDAEDVREENEELRERIAQLEARLAEAMEYVGRLREDVDRTRAISRKYMRQAAVSPLAKNMIVADDDDDDDDEAVGLEPLPSASTIRFQLPPPPEPSVLVQEDNDHSNDPSVRRSRKSPSLSSAEFPNMPSNMSMLLHDPGESQLERESFMSRDDDDHNDMMDDDGYHENHHWDDHALRSPSPTLILGSAAYHHHHQRLHSRQTSSGNLSQSTENLSMLTENLPDSPHSLELRPEHEMHLEEMPSQLDLRLQPEHELFPQLIIGADRR